MSQRSIQLEEISKKDLPIFWQLHWAYLEADIFDQSFSAEDREYFRGESYRGTIERYMEREPDRAHVVYFVSGDTHVGCAQYVIYKSEDGKCFLLDFWVFPAYRGNGMGTRCFNALASYAQADGAKYFEINVASERARRFWERAGFVDNGVDEYGDPLMKKP